MRRAALPNESAGLLWVADAAVGCRAARWLGVVALGLQAIILGYVSGARLFPAVVLLLACWAGVTRFRFRLQRGLLQLLCAMIAIGFLLYSLIAPFEFPMEAQFIRTPLAHTIARFLICMQLLALVYYREPDHPPIWLSGLGAIGLPFAANIRVAPSMHFPLVLGIVSFVAVAALYTTHARRAVGGASPAAYWTRRLVTAIVLVTGMSLGGGSAVALQRHEHSIEWFLREYLGYGMTSVRPAFSPSGRLTDVIAWKTLDADQVALRVFADQEPGYLRAKAFDTYRLPQWEHSWRAWTTDLSMRRLPPVSPPQGLPPLRKGDRVFELDQNARGPWVRLEVWPETQLGPYVFTTLHAAYLAGHHDHVTRDAQGNVMAEDKDDSLPYLVITPQTVPEQPLSEDQRALLTSVDAEIDSFVYDLAADVFSSCRTPGERIQRVQQWFRSNFAYRLGVQIPRQVDPLVYFLKERPPAHCEFFATGTAILLRIAGVPCRYVTGYVVAEKNAVGDYWIARNKDAHAWVEAYDDDNHRWVIVESTPSAGVPALRGDTTRSQLLDSARHWGHMLARSLRSFGFRGVVTRLLGPLFTIPGLLALMVSICAFFLWNMPRLTHSRGQPADYRRGSLHVVLRQLDRAAAAHGSVRTPQETLMQFAERIRSADAGSAESARLADCYERYATLRFRGLTDTEAVEQLQHTLARIPCGTRNPWISRLWDARRMPLAD
jgi:hypothetical protein